jgi:hypothetical protein
MKTRTKRHWLLVALFVALCVAAIARDCSAGETPIWVSYLSSRLSGDLDGKLGGKLGGTTFQLHISLSSPASIGLMFDSSATR